MSPVRVKPTSRLSKRLALNHTSPRSKSMPPAKLTCSRSSGASSAGMLTRSTPMMTSDGTGMSRTTPISSEIIVGVPQPSLPIGATTKWPSASGKIVLMSLAIRLMLATTSCGNRIEFTAPVRTPAISAGVSRVRLRLSRPPTPIRVKPKPSWIGVNSAVTSTRKAKPSRPSGNLVLMIPKALRSMTPWKDSSSAPMYSPAAGSKRR